MQIIVFHKIEPRGLSKEGDRFTKLRKKTKWIYKLLCIIALGANAILLTVNKRDGVTAMKKGKALVPLVGIALVLLQITTIPVTAITEKEVVSTLTDTGNTLLSEEEMTAILSDKGNDYSSYLAKQKESICPQLTQNVEKSAAQYSAVYPEGTYEALAQFQGHQDALLVQESLKYVEYNITVPEAGFYNLQLEHYPMNTGSSCYEFSLQVNGSVPFSQAASLYLYNIYHSESDKIITDANGNEFAPNRIVEQTWTKTTLSNPDEDYDEPLQFYLQKGDNVLRFNFQQPNAFVLGNVNVCNIAPIPSYTDYRKGSNESSSGNECLIMEAEASTRQSDSTLRPASDRTDRMTSPYSSKNQLMNIIDSTWNEHGSWLEWEVDVKQSGYYRLSFRYQQEAFKDLTVDRRLFIDGKVPFKEASCLQFPYTSGWDFLTASDEKSEPYYFYLTAGSHTLRMEAVLGELGPIVRNLDDVVYDLNALYRRIIMITSTNVDKYRDYNLEKEIPNLLDDLSKSSIQIKKCYDAICRLSGGNAADCAILMTTVRQLESFIQDPQTIPYRLTSFQSNIGSVSAWGLDIRRQPLSMDYFVLWQDKNGLPKTESGFFDKVIHSVSMFLNSFVQDYSSFGTQETGETISMWLGTGRDQAEILWKMSNDLFTSRTGINVEIKLVNATMVEAFLSGDTPDVAINVARDIPINLAVRSALLDLSSFNDFSDVQNWFQKGSLTPYTIQNSVYGLPDTQTFNMMFYRRDILEELGLPIPKTWDEFISVTNQLHLYKLEAGIPTEGDASIYYTMLMQNQGQVFSDDLSHTMLDSAQSLTAFESWTNLYTKVGLPLSYNMFNRFRSGEMPLAIAPYTMYNQLESAAPEIRNLWDMTPIPGTIQSNGSIDRTQCATGTAAVILSTTTHAKASWQFVKWWVGSEAQTRYAKDIESKMGVIARTATANVDAFSSLGWTKKQLGILTNQRDQVNEIAQVPGNYYLDRDLINAFRDVVYNDRNALESILQYGNRIDGEISRKREEFGLD